MNKSISNSKKLIPVFVVFIIAFSLVFSFSKTYSAYAMTPYEVRSCDFNSGIVFDNYDHIGIESQVLDVTVNEDLNADISAKYIIKNYSQESISANTLFFLSAVFGENKEISIKRNDENLEYSQEFFEVCNLYRGECNDGHGESVEEWERILYYSKDRPDPFGDGGGYFEYRITKESGSGDLFAEFLPEASYFYGNDGRIIVNASNGYNVLSGYDNRNGKLTEIVMVSSQNISFRTNGTVTKTDIENIYDYLFDNACEGIDSLEAQFIETQFDRYLNYINDYDDSYSIHRYSFFKLNNQSEYIAAIKFLIDFEPFEQIELNVSYSCQPGGRITGGQKQELTGDTLTFVYYLSNEKYTKEFKNFEINFTLEKKFDKPDTQLTKTGDKTFQYKSTSLPPGYLNYSFNNEKSYFWLIMLVIVIILAVAAFGLFLIKVAIVSVVVPLVGFIFKSLINLFKKNKS